MTRQRDWLLVGVIALLVGIVGCGKKDKDMVRITGKVTLNGAPLEKGEVQFTSNDGSTPPAGAAITAGSYDAKVPLGPKTVRIRGYKTVGQRTLYQGVPNSPTAPIVKCIVDERLLYEVTSSAEKDFELKIK
jgi:hypothetical protein